MSLSENFRKPVSNFLAKNKMPESTFGRNAIGDSKFVYSLNGGRSPSLDTADKVLQWMRDYKRGAVRERQP